MYLIYKAPKANWWFRIKFFSLMIRCLHLNASNIFFNTFVLKPENTLLKKCFVNLYIHVAFQVLFMLLKFIWGFLSISSSCAQVTFRWERFSSSDADPRELQGKQMHQKMIGKISSKYHARKDEDGRRKPGRISTFLYIQIAI